MSMISSFSSTTNLYQTVAQSAEAVDGARQAFRDTDRKSGNNENEDHGDEPSMEASEDTAAGSAVFNHRYVLNVTA